MRNRYLAICAVACFAVFSTAASAASVQNGMGIGQPAAAPMYQRVQYGARYFFEPRMRGAIVDHCLFVGRDCERGGADAFCQSAGFSHAIRWEKFRPGRTYVLGNERYCPSAGYSDHCVGLKSVVCD